jgi:adenylate cyclase
VVNAIRCLKAITTDFIAWNDRRERSRQGAIQISVGLHYGPVVVGNIGTARRLEFACPWRHGERREPARGANPPSSRWAPRMSGAVAEAVRDEAPEEAARSSRDSSTTAR